MLKHVPKGEGDYKRLTRCPACGEDLTRKSVCGHIGDHDPEDFGLSPLGQSSALIDVQPTGEGVAL